MVKSYQIVPHNVKGKALRRVGSVERFELLLDKTQKVSTI